MKTDFPVSPLNSQILSRDASIHPDFHIGYVSTPKTPITEDLK